MINCEKDNNLKNQIQNNIIILSQYKDLYSKKIELYNKYLKNLFSYEEFTDKITNFIKIINIEIKKIDATIKKLKRLLQKSRISKKAIRNVNRKYNEIKNSFAENFVLGEEIITEYMGKVPIIEKTIENQIIDKEKIVENSQIIENNDTLLISEPLQKVILPYKGSEISEILNNQDNDLKTVEEVIEKKFTKSLASFKFQAISRYKETMKLAINREKYSFLDAVTLATEMMKKRYLYPAIISACRSLDELDVYLDCLDKNELDDFKIFKIKYDLYPLVQKKTFFSNFFKGYTTDEQSI